MTLHVLATFVLCTAALARPAAAEAPQILATRATQQETGWTIEVTLRHPDTGWDHFASGWEVLGPDGARLGYRELTHPHVDEQPFTRSLSGIPIPDEFDHVLIRARCTMDGWAAWPVRLDLPGR